MPRPRPASDPDPPQGARHPAGQPQAARRLRDHRPTRPQGAAPGPDHRLPRARVSAPERPGAPDREPQRLHCLRPQSCRRGAGRIPDLRTLRRGRRGVVGRCHRDAHVGGARGRIHAQIPGARAHRRLHPLRRGLMRRGDEAASPAAVIGAAASAVARPLDAAAAALAVVLCLSWGFNQVAVKLALPEIPPLIQAAFRSTFGALIVVAWARARGVKLMEADGTLVPGIAAGLLFALEFILIFRGLMWTDASRASLFLYTAPFIVVIGARWLLPGDRFDRWQWAGLVLSFAGMVVAFGVPTPGGNPHELIGDLMLVLAGAAWAATTLLVKATRLVRVSYEKTLLYQLIVSAPMLALFAQAAGERVVGTPSAVALASLLYQTGWVVAVTFLAWFALIQRYSASRLSVFTFLTPLFGIAAGHVVLGDPLTPAFALAAALVVAGLVLVNRPR